jgi:nuclear pore complex protein Nup133
MKAEDAELKHYIEKCRLDKWFEGAFDLAKQSVKDELNEQTEGGINMQEIADELEREEERISAASNKAARELLLSKPRYKPRVKLSGSMAGFRSSVRVV